MAAYERSSLLGAKPALHPLSISYIPCIFYSLIIALCFLSNSIPLFLNVSKHPHTTAPILFYLQSGMFNDWLYAIIGSVIPPALESCVSIILQHEIGSEGRRISKKSKSLNAMTKSAMKLPTALVTIYIAFGNPWMFLVIFTFQVLATLFASRLASKAQDRRATRDNALEGDNINKALSTCVALRKTGLLTPEGLAAINIVQRDINRALGTSASHISQSQDMLRRAATEYTASLNQQGLFVCIRKLLLLVALIVCSSRETDQAMIVSLSHRMLALDDICDKIAENVTSTLRILHLMAEGTRPCSMKGIQTIWSNWAKACEADWGAGWGGRDPWPRETPERVMEVQDCLTSQRRVGSLPPSGYLTGLLPLYWPKQ
ncbi:hypothetical protein F5B17DRAFT_422581 [Nemania serpens]|nr:hypothetical protein F5B17DRAFT_422581 [Nemania serpens]